MSVSAAYYRTPLQSREISQRITRRWGRSINKALHQISSYTGCGSDRQEHIFFSLTTKPDHLSTTPHHARYFLAMESTLGHEDYMIGLIGALILEMAAVLAILNDLHDPLFQPSLDLNNYHLLGRIGEHNVVILCLPAGVTGKRAATAQLLFTFKSIKFGLMVGIGVGVPSTKQEIRLGDVVVGHQTTTIKDG